MKILVIGLGNDLLSDDAIGLLAVRELLAHPIPVNNKHSIEYVECSEHGIALLDYFLGFDAAIILDAIKTGTNPPGTIFHLTPADFSSIVAPSPHYTGLPEMIAIAKQLSLPFPHELHIFACETFDTTTLGGEITRALMEALPAMVNQASETLHNLCTV